jgi:hypothetical protein
VAAWWGSVVSMENASWSPSSSLGGIMVIHAYRAIPALIYPPCPFILKGEYLVCRHT